MKLTEELAKKIYEITNTDYSGQLKDFEIIDLIEELVNKINDLEKEKKDIEQDRDDNYKPLSYKELW
ncbi:MAG: hypothetical protein SOZ53_06365 [Candidatus Onthovivens sp.]|nr:hypothetical protein [Candidatus Onthovivens sp.]